MRKTIEEVNTNVAYADYQVMSYMIKDLTSLLLMEKFADAKEKPWHALDNKRT